jgi:hypothetical protein
MKFFGEIAGDVERGLACLGPAGHRPLRRRDPGAQTAGQLGGP